MPELIQRRTAAIWQRNKLFGQLVFSSLVDHFGLFGLTKYEFNPKKLVGLFIVLVGLVIMTMV